MYVSSLDKLPKSTHFALITTEQEYHGGDERSRTNPGHGYPAYTSTVINYQAFDTRQDLLAEVEKLERPRYGNRTPYVVIEAKPMTVKTNLQISVD